MEEPKQRDCFNVKEREEGKGERNDIKHRGSVSNVGERGGKDIKI